NKVDNVVAELPKEILPISPSASISRGVKYVLLSSSYVISEVLSSVTFNNASISSCVNLLSITINSSFLYDPSLVPLLFYVQFQLEHASLALHSLLMLTGLESFDLN